MKNLFKLVFLCFGIFTIIFSCEKDNLLTEPGPEQLHPQKPLRIQLKTGKNVSKVAVTFLKEKTNNSLKVSFSKNKPKLSTTFDRAKETALGTINTEKEIVVLNENNTKHTFQIISQEQDQNSITNIIVVETVDGIFEYFLKYNFIGEKPFNADGTLNLLLFNGTIETYNSRGILTGTLTIIDGELTDDDGDTTPCPDDEDFWDGWDDYWNDTNNNSGGGTGGIDLGNDDDTSNTSNPYAGGSGGWISEGEDDCGLSWHYQCNAGFEGAHESTENSNMPGGMCSGAGPGQGGILIVTGCNGSVIGSGRNTNTANRDGIDPCNDGTVGVLIDVEEIEAIKDEIIECLGIEDNALDNLNFSQINDINNYLIVENECSEEAKGLAIEFSKIVKEIPTARFDRFRELEEIISEDPWVLIQNCAEQNGLDTSNYLDLYNLPFPQECTDRLNNSIGVGPHQPITDGNVPLANIDYYSVEVTVYPDFNDDGTPDSEAEMYQAFRNKFIDLASGEVEDFQLSCDTNFDGLVDSNDTGDLSWEFVPVTNQDGIDFVSNNPIASILLIEATASGIGMLAADDGAVIVSDFTNNDWTISTIATDNNGTQPFSGNRQWGWLINENGNFEFFTRAVDVANISKLLNFLPGGANTECQQDTYYNIAEATWKNMQEEIAAWINNDEESNGGQATIVPSIARRVDREKIVELLTRNETIDQINCD